MLTQFVHKQLSSAVRTAFALGLGVAAACTVITVVDVVVGTTIAQAADLESAKAKLDARLKVIDEQISLEEIKESPIEGLLELTLTGGQVVYSNPEGTWLISGKLLQLTDEGLLDPAAAQQQAKAIQLLKSIPESQMVVYPAKEAKTSITIFTDVDCPYCQKLHGEVAKLNELGVTVRYLAFPRMGADSETSKKMQAVWCSEDRAAAMDRAMKREAVQAAECENPVVEQFNLGRNLGVSGTPSVILADGTVAPGYNTADKLAEIALEAQASK